MLHIVTLRSGDVAAQAHIVADGCDHAFCAEAIPAFIMLEWNDPRSPYKNRQENATCIPCIAEWHNGRRYGWRGDTPHEDAH